MEAGPISSLLIKMLHCVVWLSILYVTSGSSGDTDYNFRVCVRDCLNSPQQTRQNDDYYSVVYLAQVLQWDPLSECEYTCMRSISDSRVRNDYPVLKYFGHWPYHRILGLQEPASALFSLCNALPHVYHLAFNRHRLADTFRFWVGTYGVMAIIAWLSSTIFHVRKVSPTIFMDYASALMFLVFGLFVALRRTLHFSLLHSRPFLSLLLFGSMAYVCLARVYAMYQGQIRFDSHMSFSIGVAGTHTAVWIFWLLLSARESKAHKLQCLYLQLWFIVASMLELFDFPPLFYHFDAHSLWHLATIPLGHLWYEFWFQDAEVLRKLEKEGEQVNYDCNNNSSIDKKDM
jgi:post-GPI attachment to proteins factor 3